MKAWAAPKLQPRSAFWEQRSSVLINMSLDYIPDYCWLDDDTEKQKVFLSLQVQTAARRL